MTRNPIGVRCVSGGLSPAWPGAGRRTAVAWASIAGSWSAPSPGSANTAAYASVMNVEPISMKRLSR
jgi:hypothetical protein